MGQTVAKLNPITEQNNNDESIGKWPEPKDTEDVKYDNSADDHEKIESSSITIIHISDTHDLHAKLLLPAGDMLIHTGDFCNTGSKEEYARFNAFLGKHVSQFPLGIFVVLGNHDYKFLDGTGQSEELIATMANDKLRKTYFQRLLPNANIIDNELVTVVIESLTTTHSLTMFGAPWNPFQMKPTYPEKLPKASTGHHRVLQEWMENNKTSQNYHNDNVPNFYDRIPDCVDIILSHVPPFGVFDQMPVIGHWGSSPSLLKAIMDRNVRAVLFGHVHAQRGYWEKVELRDHKWKIIGGCEYAATTDDTRENGIIHDLMMGKDGHDETAVQFIANTALRSDRTVQTFAKKKLVGKPRVIQADVIDGKWVFHGIVS
eukprot:215018_1